MGFGVLFKVIAVGIEAVARAAQWRASEEEAPTVPRVKRPAARRVAPAEQVQPSGPHLWCVTSGHGGRNRSAEHCAYCHKPKTEENERTPCRRTTA